MRKIPSGLAGFSNITGVLTTRSRPARAIQELAGHKDLSTSQRYMHLSPAAIQAAIDLLDTPVSEQVRGDILETENTGHSKLPC